MCYAQIIHYSFLIFNLSRISFLFFSRSWACLSKSITQTEFGSFDFSSIAFGTMKFIFTFLKFFKDWFRSDPVDRCNSLWNSFDNRTRTLKSKSVFWFLFSGIDNSNAFASPAGRWLKIINKFAVDMRICSQMGTKCHLMLTKNAIISVIYCFLNTFRKSRLRHQ